MPNDTDAGRFSFDGLDRVLHEKARLGILASLLHQPQGLVFNQLRDLCALTDGNLSRHLQMLEASNLVEIWKGHKGRRPQTLVRFTESGRRRFLEYLAYLEQIVAGALAATPAPASEATAETKLGFSPT